jgi:hypothetical protein
MATPPTKIYDWATDPTFDDAVGPVSSPWHFEPNKIEPISQRIAQGYVPSQSLDAESLNYVLNSHGEWIEYLDEQIVDADTALSSVFASAIDSINLLNEDQQFEIDTIMNELETTYVPVTQSLSAFSFTPMGASGSFVQTLPAGSAFGEVGVMVGGAGCRMVYDLNKLPSGIIDRIELICRPGAAESTTLLRSHALIMRNTNTFASASLSIGAITQFGTPADNTANVQSLILSGAFPISNFKNGPVATNNILVFQASNQAASFADRFYGALIYYRMAPVKHRY